MKKGKFNIVVLILTIMSMIITLISAVFNFVIPVYLSYKFQLSVSEVDSIGVIGGADGTTSIYVTSSNSYTYLITLIFAMLSILGVAYQIYTKKTAK